MKTENEVAFSGANYSALTQIASELGIQIPIDKDVELAQNFGAKISGLDDLEPREVWMLSKIMDAVTPENIPPTLIVYLNDRKHAEIDELDVPTVFARRKHVALNNLLTGVEKVIDRIEQQKSQQSE